MARACRAVLPRTNCAGKGCHLGIALTPWSAVSSIWGLRAGEVVTIDLDDIDWEAGTLRIAKNKSRRVDVLPLPQTTGQSIATYLRVERPPTTSRRVFVRHVAPVDAPIGPEVLRKIVREACRRSGLPHTKVHILRHTLAGRMLASRAPSRKSPTGCVIVRSTRR
ncbi:tyrosine-type recombinase/integrase [Cupriavidus sp. KK10]|uniref:tyrosine-type recombinase/integrase n=1 Tax=Cupriavidus sp. KK10 TaxID=1478019 RepID=UPI002010C877|nr:tyrosine-type recombinase/integrase [Cupriavidus sp. KK10]